MVKFLCNLNMNIQKYSFEISNQEMLFRKTLTNLKKKLNAVLKKSLVHPAYDYIFKNVAIHSIY